MTFSDEMTAAAADIGAQLHDESVTVTNPPARAAGTLNTTTGVRSGATPAASTFLARRERADNARAGGEAGMRTVNADFVATQAAVAAGGDLTADTIEANATLAHAGETWTVRGATLEGKLVRIRCARNL